MQYYEHGWRVRELVSSSAGGVKTLSLEVDWEVNWVG